MEKVNAAQITCDILEGILIALIAGTIGLTLMLLIIFFII